MKIVLQAIDRLAFRVRSSPFLLRFTLLTRILLAAGFIPTGMVKVLGRRFTVLDTEHPIGAFFEAMYQTGLFWNFIGLVQVVAGLLLLIPRTAHLGATIFLPVMVNIFVITVALDFTGTPVVTGFMVLAVLYLCAWDWTRFRGLFTTEPLPPELEPPALRLDPLETAGFALFALGLLGFFGVTRSLASMGFGRLSLGLALVAGVFTLARFLTTGRRMRGV